MVVRAFLTSSDLAYFRHHEESGIFTQASSLGRSMSRTWVYFGASIATVLASIAFLDEGGDPVVLSMLIFACGSHPALVALHRGDIAPAALTSSSRLAVMHCVQSVSVARI